MTELTVLLLQYLHDHPHSYQFTRRDYQNVAAFIVDDTLVMPSQHVLFPDDRLSVVRMAAWFVPDNPALIDWLAALIDPENPLPTPDEVWLTSSHLTQQNKLLIEVSFE